MTEVVLRDEEARIEEGIEDVEAGWRKVAKALRTIRDDKLWKDSDGEYNSYRSYYEDKWEAKLQVKFNETRKVIRGLEVVEGMETSNPLLVTPQSPNIAATLGSLPEEERPEFWQKGVVEQDKPDGRIADKEVRQRVKRYKQVKENKTAGETLTDEDWKNLPSPELTPEEEFVGVFPSKVMVAISKLDPEGVAEAAVTIQRRPNDLQREVEKAQQIKEWFEQYEGALNMRLRKGIHAVNS